MAETFRDRKVRQAKRGKTVDEIIQERIDWMKTPVRKPDGEMRLRIETWENVASHLRRFISPSLGRKIAGKVTKHDIATLSNDIVAGKLGVPSIANARHMHRAASGLFNWAAEAGRDYVTASPASTYRSSIPSTRARGSCQRMKSGFSGTASTATTFLGIAELASRSSSSWSPCCAPTNCSARTATNCSILTRASAL
ncbi:MAG TPA: hypothetical protein VGJ20_31145 [Xanthobacteraceae bacterium]